MKLKWIGCGVFRHELQALSNEIEHEVDLEFLPQGLHATPDILRRELQTAIDNVDPNEGYSGILVGYGLCCRGVEGVMARNVPLILPRTHDCIAVFLGSHARYTQEFGKEPGTYWFTRGFIESGGQPGVKGKYPGIFAKNEALFEEYHDRYGEEIARYLVEDWTQGWMHNYSRAAFVSWEYDQSETDRKQTRECASNLGWCFEEIPADFTLLRDLLNGKWDPGRFLVVLPGMQIVTVHDSRIMDAMTPSEAAAAMTTSSREETVHLHVDKNGQIHDDDDSEAGSEEDDIGTGFEGLGIGLDAGGTFTDAVLYDPTTQQVIHSAKGHTTHHDPVIGISEALDAMPDERFGEVKLVSLATTFATNAIVEGKGCKVGLLLAGYGARGLERIQHRPLRTISGSHDVQGKEREPLDEQGVRTAIEELADKEGVDAIAVAGIFGCRNPEHERQIRAIAAERFGGMVVCAHELSTELNALLRASTVVLNARIVPVMLQLVKSVQHALKCRGIEAELTVVRADGSLVKAEEACERPVEMILSGPAASICGAHALTGLDNALIVDMGGTTSDVAQLNKGVPVHDGKGAIVGSHHTTVRAPAIRTTGLGGDSEIHFSKDGKLHVGPRRIAPLSWLATKHDTTTSLLEELSTTDLAELRLLPPSQLFLLNREPDNTTRFSSREMQIIDRLREGPCSILGLSRALDYPYLSCIPLQKLEDAGIILRAGLTPTDLLHVEGTLAEWSTDVANLALGLVATRHGLTPEELLKEARDVIRRLLMRVVLASGMSLDEPEHLDEDRLVTRMLDSAAYEKNDGVIKTGFNLDVPLIGIGAPSAAFIPEVAQYLGTDGIVPKRAGVAGAVGAITGVVMERVLVLIRPGEDGFTVHAPDQARRFAQIDNARTFARDHAVDLVRLKAQSAGAGSFNIRVQLEDRQAASEDGGIFFMETRVIAEATGAPQISE